MGPSPCGHYQGCVMFLQFFSFYYLKPPILCDLPGYCNPTCKCEAGDTRLRVVLDWDKPMGFLSKATRIEQKSWGLVQKEDVLLIGFLSIKHKRWKCSEYCSCAIRSRSGDRIVEAKWAVDRLRKITDYKTLDTPSWKSCGGVQPSYSTKRGGISVGVRVAIF